MDILEGIDFPVDIISLNNLIYLLTNVCQRNVHNHNTKFEIMFWSLTNKLVFTSSNVLYSKNWYIIIYELVINSRMNCKFKIWRISVSTIQINKIFFKILCEKPDRPDCHSLLITTNDIKSLCKDIWCPY